MAMIFRVLVVMSGLVALAADEAPVAAVLRLAESVPPEIAAAAMLRVAPVAGAGRADLIERAFVLGAKARHRLPVAAVPGSPMESKALVISAARRGYDALSLQSAAVKQMVVIDPARARRMFGEMARKTPEAATCEDILLADLDPYYAALGAVLRSGFTAEERKAGAHLSLANMVLNQIASVPELRPATGMVAELDWPGEQLAAAMASLEAAMKTHSTFSEFEQPDNRSYLASAAQIERAMAGIIGRARKAGLDTGEFSKSYRFFVVRQMRAPRCNDTDPEMVKHQPTEASDVFGPAVAGDLPALGVQEATPMYIQGEIRVEKFWQAADGKEMLGAFLALRPKDVAVLATPEWLERASAFTGRLEKWALGAETSEADGYHQRAMLYEAMLGLVAGGPLRGRLEKGLVGLLGKKLRLREEDVVEWSWHGRSVAGLAGLLWETGNAILQMEALGR